MTEQTVLPEHSGAGTVEWRFDEPSASKESQESQKPDEKEEEASADESAPNADEHESVPENEAEASEAEGEGETDENEGESGQIIEDTDALVKVGEDTVPVKELIAGHLRQADYTRKTQELAEQRREVIEQAEQVSQLLSGMAVALQQRVPPEPDPALAQSDPALYMQQKAMHDAAMQEMQQLIAAAEQASQIPASVNQFDVETEAQKLMEKVPELQDARLKQEFFDRAESAAKQIGFAPEELENVTDHRLWLLAHYAAIGMQMADAGKRAENKRTASGQKKPLRKARRSEARRKLENNRQALRRLSQTGRLDDALAIEIDLPD